MSGYWIPLGLLLICASWWMMRRAGAKPAEMVKVVEVGAILPAPQAPPSPTEIPAAMRPVPAPLAALSLRTVDRLSPEKIESITKALRDIRRPPGALHRLVSLEFVTQATSSELADVVMSEPLVAAKVMAKVHSPIYGLREPVTKIGQAMTFIGTTSVRNICLRYVLDESFKSEDPHIRNIFQSLGEASTLGSELSLRLAQRLALPDAAGLMTHVLLSFSGHLAATVLQVKSRRNVSRTHSTSLLQRVYGQQQELGLAGSEIGRLLMREWELPGPLIDSVSDIDRLLVTPAEALPPEQAAPLAVGYLSARLGERLAEGLIENVDALDALLEEDADFHHLHGYLVIPALRDLRKVLRAPDLLRGLAVPPQGADSV